MPLMVRSWVQIRDIYNSLWWCHGGHTDHQDVIFQILIRVPKERAHLLHP